MRLGGALRDNLRYTYANGQQIALQDEAGRLDAVGGLTAFSNSASGRGGVQVQAGDTLKSLARRVYGNEAYWYVLADANGLDEGSALVAGSTLTVPEVRTSLNDANTFKPYNPADVTGPTTPSLPYIPAPDQGCGAVGMLIMVAVTIAVSVVTYGAATEAALSVWAAGAVAGAASSAAGQIVGNMTGVVDGFSLKDIALGALSGAVGAGVSSALTGGKEGLKASTLLAKVGESGASATLTPLGRSVAGLASYATGVIGNKVAGRDTGFSWAAVAATAVGSALAAKLGGKFTVAQGGESNGFWSDLGGGLVTSATTATVDRLFGLGRQDWGAVVGDAFGNTLGNSINSANRQRSAEMKLRSDVEAIMTANSDNDLRASIPGGPDVLSTDSPEEWQRTGRSDLEWAFYREARINAALPDWMLEEQRLLAAQKAGIDKLSSLGRDVTPFRQALAKETANWESNRDAFLEDLWGGDAKSNVIIRDQITFTQTMSYEYASAGVSVGGLALDGAERFADDFGLTFKLQQPGLYSQLLVEGGGFVPSGVSPPRFTVDVSPALRTADIAIKAGKYRPWVAGAGSFAGFVGVGMEALQVANNPNRGFAEMGHLGVSGSVWAYGAFGGPYGVAIGVAWTIVDLPMQMWASHTIKYGPDAGHKVKGWSSIPAARIDQREDRVRELMRVHGKSRTEIEAVMELIDREDRGLVP